MATNLDMTRMKEFLTTHLEYDIDESLITTQIFKSLSNKIMAFTYDNYTFIYREFGNLDQYINREVETRINSSLSGANYTAKFIVSFEKYRIEQYLEGTTSLPFNKLFDGNTLQFISEVVNSTSKVYDLYRLETLFKPINLTNRFSESPPDTSYDLLINKILPTGLKNFEKFLNDCTDESLYDRMKMFGDLLENFEERMMSLKLEDSLFSIAHNDNHRLNFLENSKEGKLYLIDFELATLSPLGLDIANYLIESVYDHDTEEAPFYSFNEKLLDFENFYTIYVKVAKQLVEDYSEFIGEKKEYYLSRKYFAKLLNHGNYLCFIYCFIYLNFNNHSNGQTWYFDHAFTRIQLINKICDLKHY